MDCAVLVNISALGVRQMAGNCSELQFSLASNDDNNGALLI